MTRPISASYASIDFETIYAPVNLVSAQGIRAARTRLNSFSTMVEELNLIVRGHWTDWEHQIEFTDIEEPLASQVKKGFADAKPLILGAPKFCAWATMVTYIAFRTRTDE